MDVVSTEYVEHETAVTAGDLTKDGSVRPVDVNTILKGRLHLRMANVGHQSETKLSKSTGWLIKDMIDFMKFINLSK